MCLGFSFFCCFPQTLISWRVVFFVAGNIYFLRISLVNDLFGDFDNDSFSFCPVDAYLPNFLVALYELSMIMPKLRQTNLKIP